MRHLVRRRAPAIVLAAAIGVAFAAAIVSARAGDRDGDFDDFLGPSEHVVYTETNDTSNAIVAFRRDDDGNLTPVRGSPFATGGKGVIDPSFKLGPFDSDQNVVVDRDRRLLFAVNAGSNSIAVFHIRPRDGSLEPVEGSPFPSGGVNPVSIGVRGDRLVIIHQNQDPAQHVTGATPSIVTQHVTGDGRIVPFPADTAIALPQGSSPSQALTTSDRPFVFDAEFLGGMLASYQLSPNGNLRANPPQAIPAAANVGSTAALPLGLWANPDARQLYVGLVTVSEVGVYTWDDDGVPIFERTIPIAGKALCWVRTNSTGTRLYTSDTGSRTIDVFDTTDPDQPKAIQLAPVSGSAPIFQLAVDPTDRFVYVISQRGSHGAAGNALHVLAVDEEDGTLTEVPSSPVPLSLVNPDGRPQGVAVF
jgi:6-phosphogluconolactonase (cycloisomerase 2 family)